MWLFPSLTRYLLKGFIFSFTFLQAERKSQNMYYPPDWDPSKGSVNKFLGQHPLRDRAKKISQGILVIRWASDQVNGFRCEENDSIFCALVVTIITLSLCIFIFLKIEFLVMIIMCHKGRLNYWSLHLWLLVTLKGLSFQCKISSTSYFGSWKM